MKPAHNQTMKPAINHHKTRSTALCRILILAIVMALSASPLRAIEENPEDSIVRYCEGIVAEPGNPLNYYRAAQTFARSGAPMWAMALAETSILLNPADTERHLEMSGLMRAIFELKLQEAPEKLRIFQADSTMAKIDPLNIIYQMHELNFENLSSGLLTGSTFHFIENEDKRPKSYVEYFALLREDGLSFYSIILKDFFDNRMELMNYQSKVLKAGHWIAYNYFTMGYAYPEELREWMTKNEEKMRKFLKWLRKNPIVLNEKHTVSPYQQKENPPRISDIQAIMLQSLLLIR